MRRRRLIMTGIALVVTLGVLTGCSSSSKPSATTSSTAASTTATNTPTGTTVQVTLGDTAGLDGPMSMTVSPATAPAGDVTFVVKNNGTIDHEMVVLKTGFAFDKIPVKDAGDPPAPVATGADKVSEDNNVGETGEPDVAANGTRTFTVSDMTAGKYALVCNIAKHYGLGMRIGFTVN